jgi:hypothetical protein
MLLPTQQTNGLAASNMMQSMLDGIEEQRKQDEEKRTGKERDKVTEARLGASEEARRARDKIASALFGSGNSDAAALKIDLIERLGKELGIDTEEARSSYRLGKALEDALKDMRLDEVRSLSETIGLADLGVSMDTLLNAIKNPYGDDNERLKEALLKRASGGKLETEIGRVVQRLEDTAEPKTLEELKLGPQGYDPTRVEDAETRAERQQAIQSAEAGEKLDDVQKVQDIIEERNDAGAEQGDVGTDGTADSADVITVLAAGADRIELDTGETGSETGASLGDAGAKTDTAGTTKQLQGEAQKSATAETIAEGLLLTKEAGTKPQDILQVRLDEIGIYELLRDKAAA